LPGYNNDRFYFDDQGVRLDAADAGVSTAYVARVQLPGFLRLPGSSADTSDLQRVTIDIASTGNRDYTFSSDQSFSTYTAVICKTN
ncbi:MAG: hypothetical protein ABL962_08885, partial [Fimbriimonadaceae bacterium]